jgi:hypothetical protein
MENYKNAILLMLRTKKMLTFHVLGDVLHIRIAAEAGPISVSSSRYAKITKQSHPQRAGTYSDDLAELQSGLIKVTRRGAGKQENITVSQRVSFGFLVRALRGSEGHIS